LMALYLHFGDFRHYLVSQLDESIRQAEADAVVPVAIKVPA